MSHGISLPEAAPSPPSRKKERTASLYFGGRVQLNVIYSVSVITTVSRGPRRRRSRKYFTCMYDSWSPRTTAPLQFYDGF